MKTFSFFFALSVFVVCSSSVFAQQSLPHGEVSIEQIMKSEPIYDIYIKRYQPDSLIISKISEHELLDELSAVIIFGGWCIDSKKQIPRFLKTMQALEISDLSFYSVSRGNEDPTRSYSRYNVDKTPSIIFFVADKEIGRINESPKISIEADILSFLEGN